MTRRTLAAALVVGALASASPAAAQRPEVRLEVGAVGDTTVAFKSGTLKWFKPGMRAMVVDPRRRDVLVATLRVVSVKSGEVQAVITGQTMPVVGDHVVVVIPPRQAWYQNRPAWIGALGGLIAGFALGKI